MIVYETAGILYWNVINVFFILDFYFRSILDTEMLGYGGREVYMN